METSGPSSLDPQPSAAPGPVPPVGERASVAGEAPSAAPPVFVAEVVPASEARPPRRRREVGAAKSRAPRWRRPLVFLLLSLVSMFLAWHWSSWRWTFPWLTGRPESWFDGVVYTLGLVAVLGFHEFGHFLQAVRYRMDVSWPYMIPMPPPLNPFGTLGAVIVSVQGYRTRKELFDVGVSGPLAGLVVALPLFAWGIAVAQPVPAPPFFGEMFGMRLLAEWFHGTLPPGTTLALNPAATAGWVGLFLTGLNMLPLGQLDGGHVAYALLGKRAVYVGYATLAAWVGAMVWLGAYQLSLMVLLVLLTGVKHPPTLDDDVPLDPVRTGIGWCSLLLPLLCLTLTPLHIS